MPVGLSLLGELQQLVSMHGYWVVALIVGLESVGLPLPGETVLVLAAIYAGTEPSFNLWMLIVAAAFGAIVGERLPSQEHRTALGQPVAQNGTWTHDAVVKQYGNK